MRSSLIDFWQVFGGEAPTLEKVSSITRRMRMSERVRRRSTKNRSNNAPRMPDSTADEMGTVPSSKEAISLNVAAALDPKSALQLILQTIPRNQVDRVLCQAHRIRNVVKDSRLQL